MEITLANKIKVVLKEGSEEKSAQIYKALKDGEGVLENIPTKGFVVSQKVGGYGLFGEMKMYFQIKDPRGFKVEIDEESYDYISDVSYRLEDGSLGGMYDYGWVDGYLTLMRVGNRHYTQTKVGSRKFWSGRSVPDRQLVKGVEYKDVSGDLYIYMGRYNQYYNSDKKPTLDDICEAESDKRMKLLFWKDGEFVKVEFETTEFIDTDKEYDDDRYDKLWEGLEVFNNNHNPNKGWFLW
jgi:hypothetical protein